MTVTSQLDSTSPEALEAGRRLFKATLVPYHRFESHGADKIPAEDGALLVSNHSGGLLAVDVPMIVIG